MGWFDSLFGGDVDNGNDDLGPTRDKGQLKPSSLRDPFGRVPAEPQFDAFRSAWRAGTSLFGLFGDEPTKIENAVGPEAPNRRPDVAKIETFLGRTKHLDLAKTEGPTGYYGSRLDAGIRRFQQDKKLKVDGLINPEGPNLKKISTALVNNGVANDKERSQLSLSSLLDTRPAKPILPQPRSVPANAENVPAKVGDQVADLLNAFSPVGKAHAESPVPMQEPGPKSRAPASTKQAPLRKASDGRPVINMSEDRERAILRNTPALFEIKDDPRLKVDYPSYASMTAGREAVLENEKIIEKEAARQKVDLDLVKAIMFAENANGHYYGLAKLAEDVGLADTYFPMNIDPKKWADLGLNEENRRDPAANIRAGVTLIKRLSERIDNPTPRKIGSVYNFMGRENVSGYGAYVGRIYEEKPWLDKVSP